jgi:hypothetical protein
MRIAAQADDAPEFIQAVEEAVNGAVRLHSPETLVLIKIDNWFGFKWLGFSGKMYIGKHASLPVWNLRRTTLSDHIRVPPFVPERVVLQRRFAAPDYAETDAGEPVHRTMRSRFALGREVLIEAPKTAFAWYSGKSAVHGRGALMMHIPVEKSHWAWYVGLHEGEPWRVGKTLLIDPEWLALLRRSGEQFMVQC